MEETLGKRIVANRKRLAITQDRLAEQLGVTAQAVSKWENDQSCPDITMLPKLAEIFGISVDALLGLTAPESEEPHEAEVISEASDDDSGTVNFHLHNRDGKWDFRWDSGHRGSLCLALWVLITGLLLLSSNLLEWNVGFWDILWPTGLLVFGTAGLSRSVSFFSLCTVLLGGYFLLNNLNMLPTVLDKDILLPIFLLLFGLSLLLKPSRKNSKPIFSVGRDGKTHTSCTFGENSFESDVSFGEDFHPISLPLLQRGSASVSFGESTVDLSGCEQVTSGCRVMADCSFGQLNLRIPRRFRAEISRSTSFGSIDVSGHPDPEPQGVISLEADASFGEICITYI